ncbi:apiosidase-like domain-containing protein [Azospirillum picis]|uniref:DUF4038 domain-containing protein n=1 Tax=Azospirillum picis TaxID=488438 RepID=A0ABU0MRK6_9PROT|nr:DUF4038 domain-containing protein [Azospirillum picis]MBP2300850.1 hypothetical protein [Azospirillum picis]MDQ0536107.1 hypothetical protein [Azospirillum picis]
MSAATPTAVSARPWPVRLMIAAAVTVLASAALAAEEPRFPLSATPRYLADADGRPFLLHGDTAWSLIAELSREDAALYLGDRAARGFNTVLVSLIEHRYATNAPANAYREPPFLVAGDYATPNERYFAHADWILRRARALGILVLLTPSYMGIGGGDEGWYRAMERNGPAKLRDYGRYLGHRFQGLDNIVWVHGGDYDPPDRRLAEAIADGIREADPQALHTVHGGPGTVVSDFWAGAPWLAIDTVYTYAPMREAALRQHRRQTGRPFVLIETAYEDEHGVAGRDVRAQAYQALLGGAAGQIFGNNPIWHFAGPGIHQAPTGWKQALDSPGGRDMAHLHALFETLPWWRLEPAPDDWVQIKERGGLVGSLADILRAGGTEARGQRPGAAITTDRKLAVLYIPSARTVAADPGRLAGPLAAARWYDPTSGRTVAAEPARRTSGRAEFTVPGANDRGEEDWVLILQSATGDPGASGTGEDLRRGFGQAQGGG